MQTFIKSCALFALIFFYGCKSNSTSPGVVGNMVGYVIAHDTTSTSGYIDSLPNSGIRVSIDGTNYSAITDKDGRWGMDNIPPGTYNISFTKDSYAIEKMIAYRFSGNGTDFLFSTDIYQIAKRNASLVLRPFTDFYKDTTVIDSAGSHTIGKLDTIIVHFGNAAFSCRIFRNTSDESLEGNTIILFGKSKNLNPMDPATYIFSSDNSLYFILSGDPPAADGYPFSIYRQDLLNAGFQSGDNIFCEAFISNIARSGYNFSANSILVPSYYDIPSNKQIYTCFGNNHSEVKSFILP
jgi:hypothetical protein